MPDVGELVDRLRSHYDDACFACGRSNPVGLHLDDFRMRDGDVVASFEPRKDYRGLPETLHGGIAATALDEMLVWAGILTAGVMSVTGTLKLKFRAPVPVAGGVDVVSRIDEQRSRRLKASGEILRNGAVVAEATGLLLVTDNIEALIRA